MRTIKKINFQGEINGFIGARLVEWNGKQVWIKIAATKIAPGATVASKFGKLTIREAI